MKNNFLILLVGITLTIGCQKIENVTNTLTSDHCIIQGMPVALIPPVGHLLDIKEAGFYSNHSFIVIEEHNMPAKQVLTKFADSLLSQQGIERVGEMNVSINGTIGQKLTLIENVNGMTYRKSILAFGLDEKSYVINGTYPADSTSLADAIESSIASVLYDQSIIAAPDESVFFGIPDTQGFTIIQVLNAGIKLTSNGYEEWEANDAFFDAYVQLMNVLPENRDQFINQSIEYLGEDQSKAVIVKTEKDGMDAYEIMDTDEQRMMYRMYIFDENRVYQIIAAARVDHDQYLMKFRNLISGLVLKQ